jgi:hypothetical protein
MGRDEGKGHLKDQERTAGEDPVGADRDRRRDLRGVHGGDAEGRAQAGPDRGEQRGPERTPGNTAR